MFCHYFIAFQTISEMTSCTRISGTDRNDDSQGWKNGLAFKNVCCSSKSSKLGSQPPLTPVLRDLTATSGLCRNLHIWPHNTHIHTLLGQTAPLLKSILLPHSASDIPTGRTLHWSYVFLTKWGLKTSRLLTTVYRWTLYKRESWGNIILPLRAWHRCYIHSK